MNTLQTPTLEIAYDSHGPSDGPPVVLLHGFPYSTDAYRDVAPALAAAGRRVIVPHLRGHGPTRFLSLATPRSGQQAALGADVRDLLDGLDLRGAVLAGYDWGGRGACIAAALWPARIAGLVTIGGYNIQDIAASIRPARPRRNTATGINTTSTPPGAKPACARTAATSPACCGDSGRPAGPSTMQPSSAPRPCSTIPTGWRSCCNPIDTASATPPVIRRSNRSRQHWPRSPRSTSRPSSSKVPRMVSHPPRSRPTPRSSSACHAAASLQASVTTCRQERPHAVIQAVLDLS